MQIDRIRFRIASLVESSLEVSGVNRLLSLARELGAQATGPGEASRAPRDAAPATKPARPLDREASGVRVSLSAAAQGSVGTLGAEPSTHAVRSAPAPAPASSTPAASPPAPESANTVQGSGENASRQAAALPESRRSGAAFAAYQRNASSLPGGRIAIRA